MNKIAGAVYLLALMITYAEPSAALNEEPSAALNKEPSAALNKEPLAAPNNDPAEAVETVRSPDGQISFSVWSKQGAPHYRVAFRGREVVGDSPLGLVFRDAPALDRGLALVSAERRTRDHEWEQPWGERRLVRDHHNELVVGFAGKDDDPRAFTLRVRVFNDGLGFRYELPLADNESRAITRELTGFQLDTQGVAWWVPAAEWNRYEYTYQNTLIEEVGRAHTPFTVRLADGTHLAIHEAALLDYSGMYLQQGRWGMMHARLAPGADGIAVHKRSAFQTPWRTIQVAANATGLVMSDLILNLNEPNKLGDVSWVEPGKYIGIWWGMHVGKYTWGSGPRHGATTKRTLAYMDFAAEHGFDGVLVEGWNTGWDGDWLANGAVFSFTRPYPDFDIETIAAHGRKRGVKLVGHHETSGHLGNYESQMEEAFAFYGRHGVSQVKTGYVADAGELVRLDEQGIERREWHYGQYAVNHFIRVLETAAKHRIAINTHEPVKDTGLRRTYPNWLTREGARGQEYNAWATPPNAVDHMTTLVFTRMLAGPMDFTPGIVDLMPNGAEAQSRVPTTLARQLAAYVVLYSPVHMAADLPENYLQRPQAFEFIKQVPTDWEQSLALAGVVGSYAIIARQERGGERWFLGATGHDKAQRLDLALDFLEPGRDYRLQWWGDAEDADWRDKPYAMTVAEKVVRAGDPLQLFLAAGGGYAAILTPIPTQP